MIYKNEYINLSTDECKTKKNKKTKWLANLNCDICVMDRKEMVSSKRLQRKLEKDEVMFAHS